MGPDLGRELRQEGGTKGENAQKNRGTKQEEEYSQVGREFETVD